MSGCAQKQGGSGTKVRVARSDLVLSGGSQLSPKSGCGNKLILQLFGSHSECVSGQKQYSVQRGRACVPGCLSFCLGESYHVKTGDSVYPNDILESLERGVCVLGGLVLGVRNCIPVCGAW